MRQSKSFRELSLTFARLQKEVRATTERVHGHAIKCARNGDADYLTHVSVLIDELIEDADARGRVICFASAAEFGLSLRHQGERCRQAAVLTGSESVMVLYWAALRRMPKLGNGAAARARLHEPLAKNSIAETATVNDAAKGIGQADTGSSYSELCQLCAGLQVDSRCANGHDALSPISAKYLRSVGGALLFEAQAYQCSACKARWTQYRHASEPFAMWSMKTKQ